MAMLPAQPAPIAPPDMGAQQPAMPSQPDTTADAGGQTATPQEQDAYNRFVSQAHLLIYKPEMTQQYLAMIKDSQKPTADIGQFAANVAFRVYSAAKEAGEMIPGDVLLQGGAEIVEGLIELSDEAKITDIDDAQMEEAFYAAADAFRSLMEGSGNIDMAAVKEDMATFAAAEKSGQLDQMIGAVPPMDATPTTPDAPPGPAPVPQKPMGAM